MSTGEGVVCVSAGRVLEPRKAQRARGDGQRADQLPDARELASGTAQALVTAIYCQCVTVSTEGPERSLRDSVKVCGLRCRVTLSGRSVRPVCPRVSPRCAHARLGVGPDCARTARVSSGPDCDAALPVPTTSLCLCALWSVRGCCESESLAFRLTSNLQRLRETCRGRPQAPIL